MNEKHLNPAEALATEHARTIWWARHLTVHNRDPRLRGKKAHPDFWTELIAHANKCLEAARICWDRRNSIRPDLRPTLHENELFDNRANIHIPCPVDCGVTLHDALTADQVKDWDKLQFSDEAVEHCITRLAEHLMRHRRSQIAQLL